MVEHGLYLVKDEYFADFPSPHWMWNKRESRPHYYALRDKDGMMWLIPMSSQLKTYQPKIEREEAKYGRGNCLYYHTGKVAGKERVFIISGILPITEHYISRPYTIAAEPYILQNTTLTRQLRSKAMRYLELVRTHKLKDQNGVLQIKASLLKTNKEK